MAVSKKTAKPAAKKKTKKVTVKNEKYSIYKKWDVEASGMVPSTPLTPEEKKALKSALESKKKKA